MQPQWGLIDNQYNSQHWTLTGAQNGACWNGACGHSHPIELSTFWGCSYTRESLPTTLCEGTVPAALWPISLLFSTALIVQYYLIVSLFDCLCPPTTLYVSCEVRNISVTYITTAPAEQYPPWRNHLYNEWMFCFQEILIREPDLLPWGVTVLGFNFLYYLNTNGMSPYTPISSNF